jgi:hypothetical protein
MARQAFFEVMNPKTVVESVPESPKAQQQGAPPPGFAGANLVAH